MRVAVIDVGSSTIRLLVASIGPEGVRVVHKGGARIELGREIERHGRLLDASIRDAAAAVERLAAAARDHGADRVRVVVTAPGRQSRNARAFIAAIAQAAAAPVRVLSTHEEGRLAFLGATAARPAAGTVAVCDVGGASTEIAVGVAGDEPSWVHSAEIGALRLTERLLREAEVPTPKAFARCESEAERYFEAVAPPRADAAMATGGTARALSRLVGETLGADELARAGELLVGLSPEEVSERYRVPPARARTLAAGAAVLAAAQRCLGVPLQVSRHGLRHGAALAVAAEPAV